VVSASAKGHRANPLALGCPVLGDGCHPIKPEKSERLVVDRYSVGILEELLPSLMEDRLQLVAEGRPFFDVGS
jgi:hypothetical protein